METKTEVKAEKAGYIITASTCISVGVAMIEKNLIAGSLLVIVGAVLFVIRELRKT